MGKSKTKTTNQVNPWVPDQATFNNFKNFGGQLMTGQFIEGLNQSLGTLGAAVDAARIDPAVRSSLMSQMSGGKTDPRFNAVTNRNAPVPTKEFNREISQAMNSRVNPLLTRAAQAAQGGFDAQFNRSTNQAQNPQYARGFQSTINELTDQNARSGAFDQVKRNVADQVMQDVNATFANSGMTGSSLHQQNLARGLSAGIANVENDAFQQMRDRALQAAQIGQQDLQQQRAFGLGAAQARQGALTGARAQALQGAGQLQDAQNALTAQGLQAANMQQSALANQYGQNLQAAGMRQDAFSSGQARAMDATTALQGAQQQRFGNLLGLAAARAGLGQQYQSAYQGGVQGLIGAATGGASQSTTQSQNPGLMGYLGTGLQFASLFSDERLKTDAKKVGKLDDGTPVYTYKYKDGVSPEFEGKTLMGVMAQQVKNKKAVEDDPSGFKRVNYGAL